jgi:hypothetical protein
VPKGHFVIPKNSESFQKDFEQQTTKVESKMVGRRAYEGYASKQHLVGPEKFLLADSE